MDLIVDAGNSFLKISAWQGRHQIPNLAAGQWPQVVPPLQELFVQTRPQTRSDEEALRLAVADFLTGLPEGKETKAVLVSTVPAVTLLLETEMPQLKSVDHTSVSSFAMNVDTPAEVGPDRLCNMAAAVAAGLKNALVVDAGTATTFDLLLEGVYRGGLIAPGMEFSARKLGEAAARLAPVPFAPCPLVVGTNTTSAMAAGGFHVGVQGVQGVIDGLLAQYGALPVVITGGAGRYLSFPDALFDPHWTQRGAAVLGFH